MSLYNDMMTAVSYAQGVSITSDWIGKSTNTISGMSLYV